jgi:dolichol-phosphate mannosyltransferase
VVLPAFNEAASIGVLLDRLNGALSGLPYTTRVLVVDDGSTDGTAEIVRPFADRGVELIAHAKNQGLHAAVRTGMLAALGNSGENDVIVVMDADNTHDPALIPIMVSGIAAGADLVIASRFAPGGRMIGAPAVRRLYSLGARLLLTLRFPTSGVRDFTCGYRAYRAGLLKRAFERYGDQFISVSGFACMLDILLRLHGLGARIKEVPLVLRYDFKESQSKLRVLPTIRNTIGLLRPRFD